MEPVASALREEGTPYVGTLYAGLILTAEGPKVIEFNCRMGDPEAQVVLPRLKTDLLEVMLKAAGGELAGAPLEWDERACVGVVIASGGYPGSYRTGYAIGGLERVDVDAVVFHAGTRLTEGEGLVSDGGRVVTVAALGDTLEEARRKAYANAGRITFSGSFFRKDIASA
jgi:phosphoribosylamine--glycine ligase